MLNFKDVIVRTLSLLVIISLICMFVMEGYFRTTVNDYQDMKCRDEIAGTINTVAIGASSTMDAFVPAIVDDGLGTNTYNLATPLMTMKGRYFLLKKEIERNPISTVYFEISRNTLTRDRSEEEPEGDIYELGRWSTIRERVFYWLSNFKLSEYPFVFHDTFQKGLVGWKDILAGAHTDRSFRDTAGYKPIPPVDLSFEENEIEKIYHTEHLSTIIPIENIEYFEKILKLCKDHKVEMITFTVPVSDRIVLQYDNFDAVNQQIKEFTSSYGLEYFDFNLYKETKYSMKDCFPNDDHMSEIGGALFSRAFLNNMIRVRQGEDTSEDFYDSYEKLTQIILEENK